MKKLFTLVLLLTVSLSVTAQSRSVEDFRDDYKPTMKLFFYKSTLKMFARMQENLGQLDMEGLDGLPQLSEMIDGIEKIKFFNYEGWESKEDKQLFANLTQNVLDEGYENLASARMEGNQMNVFMKERRGEPQGFVVIVQMDSGYSIIDIEGYPDVNKILELSQFINKGSNSLSLSEAFR